MQAMQQLQDAPKFDSSKQKDRRIVTWTPQEDDILREQIRIHGTESWTSIAARFKDKTSRQCRRRWYTYLNSECKKGSWTEEEDMILCEAQKIFGNRWTEIAKVVSGRTDNAVKNRFSTLCKKRAKLEALSKENNHEYINQNNKRVIIQDRFITPGTLESTSHLKKMRTNISDPTTNCNMKQRQLGEHGIEKQMHLRPPLAVLVQNSNAGNKPTQQHLINPSKAAMDDVSNNKDQGMFLKRDDPKITALMQQAELLSSLAQKVNSENTSQSIENAWKELQDFFIRSEESEQLQCKILEMDFLLKDFKDSIEEPSCSNTGSWQRQLDLQDESQGSSEYSTGSTNQWHQTGDRTEGHQGEECMINHNTSIRTHTFNSQEEVIGGSKDGFCNDTSIAHETILPASEGQRVDDDGIIANRSDAEFSSPPQMVPFFQPFGEGIPSPKFTDSERHFLLNTLGLASPSATNTNPSCRRALLHSL
ncbi:hypothetical protein AAC387_Pa11g2252 [Persea americana]